MGMGTKECNYNLVKSTLKCKCCDRKVITICHVTEESDFPPFERNYTEHQKCDCPNNFEICN